MPIGGNMTPDQTTALAQLVVQGLVSAVFIWAWSQERKERQDQAKAYAEERALMLTRLVDLAREAYGLRMAGAVKVVSTSEDGAARV
jgi:hypothetical protein